MKSYFELPKSRTVVAFDAIATIALYANAKGFTVQFKGDPAKVIFDNLEVEVATQIYLDFKDWLDWRKF